MRRRAVVLVSLVVLLALVAIASTGSTPTGSGSARRPAAELLDTMFSLLLVAMVAGSVLVFYAYYLRRANAHKDRRDGKQTGWRARLVAIGIPLLLLALAARVVLDSRYNHGPRASFHRGALDSGKLGNQVGGYKPRFATIPVIVILGIAGAAGVAAYFSRRARLREPAVLDGEQSLELALADVLAETLDDLRAEPDPRTAVVAAYARLERTLAAYGVPRRPSEAPEEYLRRVLVGLEVGTLPARRLTELFAEAKFSQHPVGREMKDEAIELLESIRANLLAAEATRDAGIAAAVTTEPEPA